MYETKMLIFGGSFVDALSSILTGHLSDNTAWYGLEFGSSEKKLSKNYQSVLNSCFGRYSSNYNQVWL